VLPRCIRALIAFAVALVMAAGSLLPPPHAHVVRSADGRLRTVVHQHWAPHHLLPAAGSGIDDEDTATYLDNAGAVTPSTSPLITVDAIVARWTVHAVTAAVVRPSGFSAALPHSPPRRSRSPRAPPLAA